MSRKVYIVSDGGHDYSSASNFGEIVFCTDKVIRKDDIAQMYRELNESLESAEPDDLLLISSLTSLCVVAAGILASRFGELHLLLYKDNQYVKRDLIL
ncbi:MAG: hypothetical protein DDT31_00615 [Syntrophomonadaceae bacterium]|nr:hypothetical protein [Bacillota bacterium]